MKLYYDVFETPFGWMGVLASDKGLRRTTLPQDSPAECVALLGSELDGAVQSPERFAGLRRKLVQVVGELPRGAAPRKKAHRSQSAGRAAHRLRFGLSRTKKRAANG